MEVAAMSKVSDYEPFSFKSATQTGTISGRLYSPEQPVEPITCVQIIHGMAEHMARYHSFCIHLAQTGYFVCIYDQAGHGASIAAVEHAGFFGPEHGSDAILEDVESAYRQAQELMMKQTGKAAWSRVMLGHSMGSFITRLYCTRYPSDISGVILSGTAGPNPMTGFGYSLARLIIRLKGPEHRSSLLQKLFSAGNLKRIPQARTSFDWLTRDQEIVDAYCADPLCGFGFTAAGYRDLLAWLEAVSKKDWAGKMPLHCPVLIMSGGEDPIGNYGKGPNQVAQSLMQTGHIVEKIIYPGSRHECINEINRDRVWQDITNWIGSCRSAAPAEEFSS